jgi:hypothetical protein
LCISVQKYLISNGAESTFTRSINTQVWEHSWREEEEEEGHVRYGKGNPNNPVVILRFAIVPIRQLIWTIYKIKCSKNIQELKNQANFRVWAIWKSLFCWRCGYEKGTMTIAFIHSFHDVLPMCSVFQTCQTAAASSQ